MTMTAAGTALAISANAPATQDATGFAALTLTEIGGVENLGPIGPVFSKVETNPLKGPKDKLKGSVDYGSLNPSIYYDRADAGQVLLKTAAKDKTNKLYTFLATLPNGEKWYFQGRVFGMPIDIGGVDSLIMSKPTVEICTEPVEVAVS